MGLVFEKINVETPKFEVIKSTDDYEICKYSPLVIAEVIYDPTHFKGNKDGGFINYKSPWTNLLGNIWQFVIYKVEELRKGLERDGYKVIGEFLLARYNPPWTLPAFRTNEVLLPIE